MSRWPYDDFPRRRVPKRVVRQRIHSGQWQVVAVYNPGMSAGDDELARGIDASRRIAREVRADVERLKQQMARQKRCGDRASQFPAMRS